MQRPLSERPARKTGDALVSRFVPSSAGSALAATPTSDADGFASAQQFLAALQQGRLPDCVVPLEAEKLLAAIAAAIGPFP